MIHCNPVFAFWLLFFLSCGVESFSQGKLYTARGYWEESRKTEYHALQQKLAKGDSLTENEKNYIQDYDAYLATYFQRLPEDDKQNYARLSGLWDQETITTVVTDNKEYSWRGRDRLANGLYGFFYGSSLVVLTEASSAAAAAGIPLITAGLWMLGPAMNPKKYDGLTLNTVRASGTGKILGLVNGAALGLAIAGNQDGAAKVIFGLSSVGSIALGEIGFQLQKEKKFSAGQIEMIRHYGLFGSSIGLAGVISTGSSSRNAYGVGLLAGGISGMIIGNAVGKKYDYTRGDVDAIRSLTLISTGLGFAVLAGSLNQSGSESSILIPAITSIAGTIWGQRAVKGLHLTDKQGSTINLTTVGAALVGIGIVAMAGSSSQAVNIGVPSGLALIAHQLLLHNYKMKNGGLNLQGRVNRNILKLAIQITPESYFLNQKTPTKEYSYPFFSTTQNSLFKIRLTF